MDRANYDEYIRLFNAKDPSAFESYLADDVEVQNGRLHFRGLDGMKEHYAVIWRTMDETLTVKGYVSDGSMGAALLHTHFDVRETSEESPFGPVKVGESFDYHGVVMYIFEDAKIVRILVSYLDFTRTDLDGITRSLGIVH